jgi:hypothetical protein
LSSNLNEELSTKASFRQSPSDLAKRRHMIIVAAKDANGLSVQGRVQINVMQKMLVEAIQPHQGRRLPPAFSIKTTVGSSWPA